MRQPPHHLISAGHTLLAVVWAVVSQLAVTNVGALIAISVSGLNAVAALLSGYAAVRTLKRKNVAGQPTPPKEGR